MIVVRSAFGYDVDAVSDACGLSCPEESLTVQSDAADTDINVLVKRFGIGAEVPHNVRVPLNDEFTAVFDFHSAMNLIREAEAGFMEMPAEVRARFQHDPGELVSFVSNDANRAEAEKLGLVVPNPLEPVVLPLVSPVSPPAG